MRFNTEGTVDNSFGTAGLVVTTMAAGFEDANGLALTSDFKVVCGGFVQQSNNDFAFARYHLGTVVLVDGCTDANVDELRQRPVEFPVVHLHVLRYHCHEKRITERSHLTCQAA